MILATAWSTLRPRLRWRALVAGTLATVSILGAIATLDLFDIVDALPWMGDRVWWGELIGGAVFALLIPLLISCLWGRLWAAGAIAGVALAFLLHVTLLILILYGLYWVAETGLSGPEGTGPDARRSFLTAVSRAAASDSTDSRPASSGSS